MVKILLFFLILGNAYSAGDLCELGDNTLQIKVDLGSEVPEYFFKAIMPQNAADKRNEATLILSGKGNVILDLKTGKMRKIDGPYDAVPSFDATIITVPANEENKDKFTIYDRNNMAEPLLEDGGAGSLQGVYQSVGIVGAKKNEKKYLVITDNLTPTNPRSTVAFPGGTSLGSAFPATEFLIPTGNELITDTSLVPGSTNILLNSNSTGFNIRNPRGSGLGMSVPTNSNMLMINGTSNVINEALAPPAGAAATNLMYKEYSVKTDGKNISAQAAMPESKQLCSNLKTQLKLPMISKDGKKLAAFSIEGGTTHIYKVSKNSNGDSTCNLERDLGFATTKVEFNKDGDKITFASDNLNVDKRNVTWKIQPEIGETNMNIFVLDLKSNNLTRVSNNKFANSYYPSFSRDDTVTYLSQEYDPNTKKTAYSLIQAKYKKALPTQIEESEKSLNPCVQSRKELAVLGLGKLWSKICNASLISPLPSAAAKLTALSLKGDDCKKMVTNYWENNKSNLSMNLTSGKKNEEDEKLTPVFEKLRTLSLKDLLAVCPKGNSIPSKVSVKKVNGDVPLAKVNPVISRCAACHNSANGRLFQTNNPETYEKFRSTAVEYVNSNYMPMGAVLSDVEKKELVDAILKL